MARLPARLLLVSSPPPREQWSSDLLDAERSRRFGVLQRTVRARRRLRGRSPRGVLPTNRLPHSGSSASSSLGDPSSRRGRADPADKGLSRNRSAPVGGARTRNLTAAGGRVSTRKARFTCHSRYPPRSGPKSHQSQRNRLPVASRGLPWTVARKVGGATQGHVSTCGGEVVKAAVRTALHPPQPSPTLSPSGYAEPLLLCSGSQTRRSGRALP